MIDIIHVGAHFGEEWMWHRWATKDPFRLHLVEPCLSCVTVLHTVLPGAHIYPVALAAEDDIKQLFIPRWGTEGASLYRQKINLGKPITQTTICLSGITLFGMMGLEEFVLFVNCEGAEFEFLPEVLRQYQNKIRLLCFSTHEKKIPGFDEDLKRLLELCDELSIENLHRNEFFKELRRLA
jgi:hypothetical protein